ncbi:MAG: ABC transporter substrate-binding protein [Pseudomonadota bacterium]
MKRRDVISLAALAVTALPLGAWPQGQKKRIGVLGVGVSSSEQVQYARLHFIALLRRAGLEEGRNIEIEWRQAEGDASRLPALAAELVRLKVDVIVASFNQSIIAARGATRTIPIVMLNALSPVERGFVASLARPGGNVTGTAWSSPETMGKIIQVIKEAAPRAKRLAIIGNAAFPGDNTYREVAVDSSARLGMAVEFFAANRPEEVGAALERVAAYKPQALYAALDTVLVGSVQEIAEFSRRKKLVSMSTAPQYVDVGGLLYYGPDFEELAERTVSFVVRILAGAKPADLPVELPTNYKLIVSKRAASAIGYKIPPGLLARADRVIE